MSGKIVSRPAWYHLLILLFGGLIFIGVGVGLYLDAETPDEKVFSLFIAAVFILIGLYGLYWFSRLDTLELDAKRLSIKSIFGYVKKEIYLKDIVGWIETEKQGKYSTWYHLTIYTERTTYMISSQLYMKYPRFKEILTATSPRDTEKENALKRCDDLKYAIGMSISSAALFYFSSAETSNFLFVLSLILLAGAIYFFKESWS